MLDRHVRPWIEPPLAFAAAQCVRAGITANHVTVVGFLVGLMAVPMLAMQETFLALVFILVNRTFDGLDGAITRRQGSTDLGGFLDISLDFIFYSAVPFGFAIGHPDTALAAAFLIFSFVGTGTSFLAYAVIAEKRGLETTTSTRKALYYIGGLTEGTETTIFFVVVCLLPSTFVPLSVLFGLLCWLTTATRLAAGVLDFRDRPQHPKA